MKVGPFRWAQFCVGTVVIFTLLYLNSHGKDVNIVLYFLAALLTGVDPTKFINRK